MTCPFRVAAYATALGIQGIIVSVVTRTAFGVALNAGVEILAFFNAVFCVICSKSI